MSINCYLQSIDPVTCERLLRDPDEASVALLDTEAPVCDVHKAWHAIHYVLTGTPFGESEPQCYLLTGGTVLGDEDDDGGYGPPRVLRPDQVRAFNEVLQPINKLSVLRRRFDHAGMVAAGVYSVSDDEPGDDLEFTAHFFKQLRGYVKRAADAGHGLVISYG